MKKLSKTETVIKFARKIVPKNWQIERKNISLMIDITKDKRKGFFIFPHIEIVNLNKGDKIGCVKHMSFNENSSWVELWLYFPSNIDRKIRHLFNASNWRTTVVHELAHIAVDRLFAMKKKDRKRIGIINSVVDLQDMGEDQHGKHFLWAYELLAERFAAIPGNTYDVLAYWEIINEIEIYKREEKK